MLLALVLLSALLVLPAAAPAAAQDRQPIAAVDLYGRFTVPDSAVRRALALAPGDTLARGAQLSAAAARVEALPGVARAHLSPICCDGGVLLYVGVEEEGSPMLEFRDAPSGAVRLPEAVAAAGAAFDSAFMAAVRAGEFAEDDSLGHALMRFPEARRIQESFVGLADRYGAELRQVLRESSDPEHRARAAQVLAYSADKAGVVADLVYAASDPSERVRNDAVRALAIIAGLAQAKPELGIEVPYEPFIGLLRSPVWTDRNKASLALMNLTAARDTVLLATLAREVMPELVRMARWKSDGHALPALVILGRIGGIGDDSIFAAVQQARREAIIEAAERRGRAT